MAWVCHFCRKEYRWDTSLMRHLKEKHLEEMKEQLRQESKKKES